MTSFLDGNNGIFYTLYRFFTLVFFSCYKELSTPDFRLLSLKRLLVLSALCCWFPCMLVFNHIGLLLDDILYPSWREELVHDPLFIVGNARSGTTWVHRLLSQDEESFTFFRTWEILFGVSVTWRIFILRCYELDRRLGGGVAKCVEFLEHSLFRFIKVHPTDNYKQFTKNSFLLI